MCAPLLAPGCGTRLRLRHGGNPAPARSPGSDTGIRRCQGAQGEVSSRHHNTCVQAVQVPAGCLWPAQLARRSTCSAWPHLAREEAGELLHFPLYPPLRSHRVSLAPSPFSPHICRLTSPTHWAHPEPDLTPNTRHRGNTETAASCYLIFSQMRSLL